MCQVLDQAVGGGRHLQRVVDLSYRAPVSRSPSGLRVGQSYFYTPLTFLNMSPTVEPSFLLPQSELHRVTRRYFNAVHMVRVVCFS